MTHGVALMPLSKSCWHICRSSKHVPSLQIHAYGRLGAKHERTLPHTSNKGPVPKPWNHSRTCRAFTNQGEHLKAEERMSLGNFYRSVHRIRSNKEHRKEENIVSPCLHSNLDQSSCRDQMAKVVTQIQATAWKEKKNEGMLVCIVHGATVLISRREKLNSVVRDLFAPWILWKNIGIAFYVLKAWGSSNRARKGHGGQQNVSETSDSVCMKFWVHGLGPWNAASQAISAVKWKPEKKF
jgi:hypothetical protein